MKAARPLWLAAFRLARTIYYLTASLGTPTFATRVGSVDTASGEGRWRESAAREKKAESRKAGWGGAPLPRARGVREIVS